MQDAKNASINLQNQFDLIYNNINVDIYINSLRWFKTSITLNEFLIELDKFKFNW